MDFETVTKCDRLTLGRNWLAFPGEDNVHSATPDQINGAIVKLENYNGTMMVLSFKSGALIKVIQNTLHYNKEDIIECQ
ncbi:MAG: hypothetical protein EB150_02805 [Nitrososphaeria archaeon]|nr:hypothetical protein [Nitrosopumilaceae archaeon]NDB87393.1 hypothetical protein [Nitrososphaerota archaeon]NDB92198.1 hypothetical protein [Nitrososphaeria archaeon]NDB90632.1 hypothetical protein [Nitrososphaerota archaeon]NDF25441.1 hypothetical protein [Nitrososphaerota archaeon]